MKHIPVLLNEVIEILEPKPGNFFIDGTIGGAGHAKEIIKLIGSSGTLLGLDWYEEKLEGLKKELKNKTKIILIHGNYADLPEIMEKENLPKADGLLLDLGFSSEQLESSGRGFSFMKDEPLDMRYSLDNELTAAQVINGYREEELADIFYKYGEERFSRRIAKGIIEDRKLARILTTKRLADAVAGSLSKNYERGRIHPATRVFQALRIYVNRELENVEIAIDNIGKILKSGGRLGIISFHSLEDRIVKNKFREIEKLSGGKILTKKPIIASDSEIASNPRSRSAKLRAIEII